MRSETNGCLRRSAWALVLLGVCSCRQGTPSTQPAAAGRIHVFVSIAPQKYFVQRVGGERVDVSVLLAPGQSPHTYEPTTKQIVSLASARVYFRIDVPFEKQVVAKIAGAMKGLAIVDTCEGISWRAMTEEERKSEHEEGDVHEEHGHGELDPHTWMSPRLVKVQARNICRALVRLDPAHGGEYESRCKAFEADLDAVDAKIGRALSGLRGREFFVFHPGFGYFADAYGLKQVAVETGGKQPSAKHLGELIEQARKAGVKLIFVQPQFARQSAEAVAQAIGGAVVPMDSLAEDYIANLLDITAKIEQAMRKRGSEK